jgi:hypothetical protein
MPFAMRHNKVHRFFYAILYFCGYEPQTPGYQLPLIENGHVILRDNFAILDLYIIQIRMLCKHSY